MNHNDVLRSLRYMLKVSDAQMGEIISLSGLEVATDDVVSYLKKEEEPGYVRCPERVMAHFLDGLVIYKRGRDESRPPLPIEVPVSNNTILKKLRVAFELKEDDLHAILKAADFPVSKPELSALFRKVGHDNYRPCGDQLLRNFLKGLTLRVRG
ncbi:YehS family protein [Pseudomonas sp. X10]